MKTIETILGVISPSAVPTLRIAGAINAIIANLARHEGGAIPTQRKRLMAAWQNGLESGIHVQRKLRLGFNSVPAQQGAN